MFYPKTWIVVTDGKNTRIFLKHLKSEGLQQIHSFSNTELVSTREHDAGKPGRVFESANKTRHAYEPPTDWHTHQKEVYLKEIGDFLDKSLSHKEFEKICLVAPPTSLGYLRSHLPSHVQETITSEVNKDLTHASKEEIEAYLSF